LILYITFAVISPITFIIFFNTNVPFMALYECTVASNLFKLFVALTQTTELPLKYANCVAIENVTYDGSDANNDETT
jgi:hypothetical protein